jgi:hypothetical protein
VIRQLYWRVYQNFLMPSRIPEYRALLTEAKARGYEFLTVRALASCASGRATLPPLALVLRSDVDTDVSTARAMFEVEKAVGIRATYYFRLSTLDERLMREMTAYGTEVGYHFEEVATAVKRLGLCSSTDVVLYLEFIREEFRRNIKRYKAAAGSWPQTVAAHGDFANRKIKTTNSCIINQAIRDEFGIVATTDDEWLNALVTMRVKDQEAPKWWSPVPLAEALTQNPKCLSVLVHSRQWRANPWENAKVDVIRVAEGAMLSTAQMLHRRTAGRSQLSRG